ncbi:MAG TPA: GNAT family N-acetyltransferase [Caulobacteraceae bacterium]|nr:GNAT family N-acetyltransferase [Caulobacteraceae bacterium]
MRRIGTADLERLGQADPRLADDPARRRHLGELLGAGMSWAAVAEDKVLGFAVVTRHFYAFPFVDLLVVGQSERRHGVGAALMAQCERDHDAGRIFTSTNVSNAPMRRLLAKAGWQASGQIDNLDPGDPELVFVKFRAPG